MIAVWFSCGAASAVALKLTLEWFPGEEIRAINTPIAEEHDDNRRFLRDVSDWCGIEIESATARDYPESSATHVWADAKAMSFIHGAPCTVRLKKQARYEWEMANDPAWHVLGFTVEEFNRYRRFTLTERINTLPILIDANLTKQGCIDVLRIAGIKPPILYDLGFPNANCIGCVKATSPTYWNHVRKHFPDIFQSRAEQSRNLGSRLVRVEGKRIFLDELHPNAKGRAMKTMPECGVFCEEWTNNVQS